MSYLEFLLACAGLTFIIVHATIMDKLKIRPFLQKFQFTKELIHCSLCTGVYVSTFFALCYFPIKNAPLYIFGGAFFSFFFERLVIFIDDCIIRMNQK
jgi:hypothetical protein